MPLPVSQFNPTVPASPRGGVAASMPDLPAFKVVSPRDNIKVEDFRLPDGSPLVGPDGYLVPPAREFSMVVNAATRIYSYRFDEAMRDNWVQARAMRRDAFIRALLEERMLPTINRKWQLEVDNDRDPNQRAVRDGLTKLIEAVPDFDAFTRALVGDGCWYGRAGCQWNYFRNPEVDDLWGIKKWDPVHGDSIQFTYDGVPAILMDAMTAGWYSANGATQGQWGDIRSTDRGGMALVLQRPTWRNRFAIYQHIREKADYFEGELAGSVQGLGLRGLVYWQYLIRTDALTWMLAYMQSVGQMDMLIFNYPWGNDAAKNQQQANANKIIGKAAFIVPRNPLGNWQAVEQLSMNDAGLKALHSLISEYFDRNIERLIVGQSMSAGADNESGMGGTGRADFARQTKDEILVYDTGRRDNCMTRDVVGPLKKYNYKWANFPVRFKSVLPDLEAKDKVASGKTMVELKVPIKMDELRQAAGFSRPEEGDEIVQPPPDPNAGPTGGGMPGTPVDPNAPPGTPQPGRPSQVNQVPPTGAPPALPPTSGQVQPNQPVDPTSQLPQLNAFPRPIQQYDAAPAASPSVAPYFPGGSNTYLPGWDETEIGLTRLSKGQEPTRYTEHKPAGPGGGQFTSGSGGGSTSAPKNHRKLNVDQANQALRELGYEVIRDVGGDSGHQDDVGAKLVKTPDGREVEMTPLQVKQAIYGDAVLPQASRMSSEDLSRAFKQTGRGRLVVAAKINGPKVVSWRVKDPDGRDLILTDDEVRKSVVDAGLARGGAVRNARGEDPTQYDAKLGCVMVPLQGQAAIELLSRANLVRDCDLADDDREEHPHVTVRFGFDPGVRMDQIEYTMRGKGPFELTLGGISCFYGADSGKDYDVVKVDVTSPQLRALNSILGGLPCTDTHKDYKPHATIAYVKKGQGDLYKKLLTPLDLTVVVDELEYSDSDKVKSYFKLRGLQSPKKTVKYRKRRQPTRYNAAHAPAGGVSVAGKEFTGGQFIPSDVMAEATPEEREKVEGGSDEKTDNTVPYPTIKSTSRGYTPTVDGREVLPDVPNMDSIGASVEDPEVLPGIREVPMSAFDSDYKPRPHSVQESQRLDKLVAAITNSKQISPLIVVIDDQGPYVLEGGHRFDALHKMGAKSFPAVVVIDKDSAGEDPDEWKWSFQSEPKEKDEIKPTPVSPTTAKVLSRLPRTAYERLSSRVTRFEEAPTVEAVTDAWYAGEPGHTGKRTPCFGFYDPVDGRLLVGPGGPNVDQQETLAHEIGHAIDQSDDRKHFQLSGDPEFVQAWKSEMGRGQLSNYARTDEVEGFAEACRLAFGTEGGMETFRSQFPLCYAYFKRTGLVE